jgi:uncharacterized protein
MRENGVDGSISSWAIEVGSSALGRGVFATRSFRPGQPLLEFSGPVLNHDEVLALGGDRAYALQVGPDEYLDTMPPGRYVNHSCDPNAGIVNDRVVIALRPIEPGEEIHFDYSTTMSRDHWTMECRCGRPTCRRVILDFHHLPPITQNRYLQLGIVQRFIVSEVRRLSPQRRVVRRTRSIRQVTY